ncbi:MAG: glucosylceramidase [Pirellulales bacterium]|nr:glucosylceramidase [Pirellulales bacterium]
MIKLSSGFFIAVVIVAIHGFALRPLSAETEASRAKRMAELTDPERLFARGESRIYRDEYLMAIRIPIGGLGTGSIQMDGQGRRAAWQLWRNFTDFPLPHSFFAVRARAGDGAPIVRVLQTVPEGPFRSMQSLAFRGEYPLGWYSFEDPALPVEVSLETFNPLIPLNEKDSAIPCAMFNLTAENKSRRKVEVGFLATQQNAAGLVKTLADEPVKSRELLNHQPIGNWTVKGRSSDQYGANNNRVLRTGKATLLHMTIDKPKDAPGYGEMVLAAMDSEAQGTASWDDLKALQAEFAGKGCVSGSESAGPSPKGQTLDGALSVPFVLKPGEKRTVRFVLTWYFPNIPQVVDHQCPNWKHDGYVYANWWPDCLSLAKEVAARLEELTELTHRYHDSLYRSNLPHWLLDRIGSQAANLRSPTVFWAKDDFFGCWEGCSWSYGSCPGNATHVWGYAHAVPRLFPFVAKKMREQEHAAQTPEGMLPCRIGLREGRLFQAFDGQCHSILASLLTHRLEGDGRWLDRQWPKIKQSMNYLIAGWDKDEDGMLSGPQHGMDSLHGGTSSWMGSMYLAALAAAKQMALLQDEPDLAARYGTILEIGAKNQDQKLFNGEYFIQIPDPKPYKDYLTGCYTDQLLGQWWANRLDLGWIYPRAHVRSAMQSLLKYNFRTDFHGFKQSPRKFVWDDEAAMIQCAWPRGGRPEFKNAMLHADEVKVGISYAVAALMVDAGLLKEGFTIVRANADRYDGRLRTGLDNTPWSCLGHSGNPFGDDMAGKFYVRPLSVWSMLPACQRQIFDGPQGVLGFDPVWRPEDHVSFFTAPHSWGVFTQRREGGEQREKIELAWGKLRLRQLIFGLPENVKSEKLSLRIAGKKIAAKHELQGNRLKIEFPESVILQAGDVLEVAINEK